MLPKISVVIPVAPKGSVDLVIGSLKKVDYPRDRLEVWVARGKQPSRQRNLATEKSNGEIVVYFDDDVEVVPGILKEFVKYYDDPKVAIVGGPNLTPKSDKFVQKCFGYVMETFFGAAMMSRRYKVVGKAREAEETDLILCNASGKRKVVLEAGGFNEKLWPNEENELFNKLRDKGYKLIYSPKAVVYHSRRSDLSGIAKQVVGYGRGRLEQSFLQPSSFRLMFLVPVLFVGYMGWLLGALLAGGASLLLRLPFMAYIGIALLFAIYYTAKKRDVRILPVLPFLYFLIHVSYGVGFIYGFLRWVLGRKRKISATEVKLEKIMI